MKNLFFIVLTLFSLSVDGQHIFLGVTPEAGAAHPTGSQTFTTTGSQSWTVPTDVTHISVVAIGAGGYGGNDGGAGGGLCYTNFIPVTAGESLTVIVGAAGSGSNSTSVAGGESAVQRSGTYLCRADGGGPAYNTRAEYFDDECDGGSRGTLGGQGNSSYDPEFDETLNYGGGGGGGPAWYQYDLYNNGDGEDWDGSSGENGAYGGGGGGGANLVINSRSTGGAGGGTGVSSGEGSSGSGSASGAGSAGSGGSGTSYGAGAAGQESPATTRSGGNGVVFIIWGDGYFFPDYVSTENANGYEQATTFEGSTEDFRPWRSGGGNTSIVGGSVINGTNSVNLSQTDYIYIPLKKTGTYDVSFWYRIEGAVDPPDALNLQYQNSAKPIGAGTTLVDLTSGASEDTNISYSTTVTVSSLPYFLIIRADSDSGEDFWIDDITVTLQ